MTFEGTIPLTPNGIYAASLDSRGRLCLPAAVEGFLRMFAPEGLMFVTTLDRKTGRIYPLPSWKAVVKALNEETVHRAVARDVLFMANQMGEDVRIDSTGRVLVPEGVRNALGTSHQRVYLECEPGGSVTIHSQEQIEQSMAEAEAHYESSYNDLILAPERFDGR